MAKEILLYGGIHNYSVERFINAVNSLSSDEELILRLNTNGGSPEDMTGAIAKFQEFKGAKKIKVDGKAYSSGAFFLLYADSENVEVTSSSKLMFHRAAYPSWMENDKSIMTDARWEYLNGVNANLRVAIESKISNEKFKEVTKVSYDELFSNDSRVDVFLTAKQAKDLGLVGKINNITPQKQEVLNANYNMVAAEHEGVYVNEVIAEVNNKVVNKKEKMTIDEIKSKHPEAYDSILALGVSQEKERVTAWNVFAGVDAKRVSEGINSGKEISAVDMAELSLAAAKGGELKSIEANSQKTVTTEKVLTEDEKALAEEKEFWSNVEG